MPRAMMAALTPTTPPPMIATLPARTPGTPPSSRPRPPSGFSSMNAPAWVAILPATSLIGASSGSRPRAPSTLSYAAPAPPASPRPRASVLGRRVGAAGRPRLAQPGRELGVRREVQVGEQRVARLEHRDLGRLRLLDLDDHVRVGEDGGGVGEDARSLLDVVGVGDRRSLAGAGLDDDL